MAEAHRVIGKLAGNAYILGGSMSDIAPLLSANGPQDLIDQLSTLNTLGARNSTALDRYKAAEIVARAAKKKADEAKSKPYPTTNSFGISKPTYFTSTSTLAASGLRRTVKTSTDAAAF